MPISLGQLAKGDKVGSNISLPEKAAAVRPAPAYMQSPERVERLQKLRDKRDWRAQGTGRPPRPPRRVQVMAGMPRQARAAIAMAT
jgi:hypothetical protein